MNQAFYSNSWIKKYFSFYSLMLCCSMIACFLFLLNGLFLIPSTSSWQFSSFATVKAAPISSSLQLQMNKEPSKLPLQNKWLRSAVTTGSIATALLQTTPVLPTIQNNAALAATIQSENTRQAAVFSPSIFNGKYNDPNHPNCLREVSSIASKEGNLITIKGSDQVDGKNIWTLKAIESKSGEILVDFSPKGGPKDLLGKYDRSLNAIQWPDGNLWTKQT